MQRACKFLQDDLRSGLGTEGPWSVGEKRTLTGGALYLYERGYHSSPDWYSALGYAPGNVAAVVEVSKPPEGCVESDKQCSRTMRIVAVRNVERELRFWGCDCAERALTREREAGRELDARSWEAIRVARAYADGKATKEELAAARAAAWAARAAGDAARAAGDAAWAAARSAWAAGDAAWAAAWAAEINWQRERLNEIINAAFAAVEATP